MAELILNADGIKNCAAWSEKDYRLPEYDRDAMIALTKAEPEWVHFGAGNIFKAFQCRALQKLLNNGTVRKGIIAVERRKKGDDTHDGLTVAVTLKADGTVEKDVIGSIAETCYLYGGEERLAEIFCAPTLKMVSFTVTEKAYSITDSAGSLTDEVTSDMEAGPDKAASYMGKLTALLYARYRRGALPVAMVSMDNCSHNGDKLKAAVTAFADAWVGKGLAEEGFARYVHDGSRVSFPWTMIDKITPSPDMTVGAMLEKDGLHGFTPVRNERGTVTAPYVNAEETEYLIIEDSFPNGRLPLDKAGIIYTDRATVDKVERMKVTTCLNPLHTALAVYGCLLGYDRIWKEMKDEELVRLIKTIGYKEGLPVVTDPGIIDPKEFIDTVVNVRLVNPFMPDTPQRIATDTSQKLPIRYGETIKAYMASDTLDVQQLRMIPLVFAGWLRYLMAVDDDGNAFTPSPDPMLGEAQSYVAAFCLGQHITAAAAMDKLSGLLSSEKVFGVDLVQCGLAERVCEYFAELIAAPGAVRATLKKYTM